MEEMNSKLSVRYEYKDARKIKQAQEISIASEYAGFSIYQITDFMLNAIKLTEYTTRDVLLSLIESAGCANSISDELIYLGYGTKMEEEE